MLSELQTTEKQMTQPSTILVVDDDRVTRELLRGILSSEGDLVDIASSGAEAMEMIERNKYPIILSDINMPELTGLDLLNHLKRSGSQAVVILITGFGSLEGAIEAIHVGAFDYLSKPLHIEELRALLKRAKKHLATQIPAGKATEPAKIVPRTLIGRSSQMVQVYKMLAKASMSSSNVLITGESGTGKELVARAIHDNSTLRDKAFVTVNCGALAENLLESELFGHVKGSFTGAISTKRGLCDEADGGTLFLDEIGDITPGLQVKLLRVIQEGEFKPVGTNEVRKVHIRVISATHRNLEKAVASGQFREDLYYRLKVISIELPSLRQRLDDLPSLINHFLQRFAEKSGKRITQVSDEAMQLLRSYTWPGNIRELEHAIERAVAMTSTAVLYAEDFPIFIKQRTEDSGTGDRPASSSGVSDSGMPTHLSLEQVERAHILRVLQDVHYNKSKAADLLGIDRATLYRKAQRYGIALAENKIIRGTHPLNG